MSRIGNKPVIIPQGIEVSVNGQEVKTKGKLGEMSLSVHDEVAVKVIEIANDGGPAAKGIEFTPRSNSRFAKQIWPTMRMLVNNMIIGVSEGYTKKLEITGVGLRANLQGKVLVMSLGFSHEVRFGVPEGIKIKVEEQTQIEVSGIDKQLVGETAAKIRGFKPPEPYKGKGIRYADEYVLRKEGKKK